MNREKFREAVLQVLHGVIRNPSKDIDEDRVKYGVDMALDALHPAMDLAWHGLMTLLMTAKPRRP